MVNFGCLFCVHVCTCTLLSDDHHYLMSHAVYMYVIMCVCIVRVPVRIEYTMGVCVVYTVTFVQ